MEQINIPQAIREEMREAHAMINACHNAIQKMDGALHGICHTLDLALQLLPVGQIDGEYESHQTRLDTVKSLLESHDEARQDILKAGYAILRLGMDLEELPAVCLVAAHRPLCDEQPTT